MKNPTREYYLSVLGIDTWIARRALPGAASSPTPSVHALTPDPLVPNESEARSGGLGRIRSLVEAPEVDVGELAAADPSSLPIEEVPDSSSLRRLHCAFWHGPGLSMVADLETGASEQSQLRLGSNIMRAIGEAEIEPQSFYWPPFENHRLPGNDDENLTHLLGYCLDRSMARRWLCLGPESASTLVASIEDAAHHVWVTSTHALSHLLANGTAKLELWERIRQAQRASLNENGEDHE